MTGHAVPVPSSPQRHAAVTDLPGPPGLPSPRGPRRSRLGLAMMLLAGLGGTAALACASIPAACAQALPAKPAAAAVAATTDDPERIEYIRSHYAKFEYRVPMRDGTKLFTAVYVPNDASRAKPYPILLVRTPYSVSPYGADRYKKALGPTAAYEKDGFIFAFQDVRGTNLSEGTFVNMRPQADGTGSDESTDTWDAVDWLVKHVPANNGKVGQWGISYPGFYTAAGAIDSHPALKAVSPQAPIADWFRGDDMHRHGAFNVQLAFGFFSGFGKPRPLPVEPTEQPPFDYGTPDGYQYLLDAGPLSELKKRFTAPIAFWDEITAHPNYDAYWQARNLLPHLKNIKAAVLVVGGWYDTEDLYGPLSIHKAIGAQSPGTTNLLVVGPWTHGGWIRSDGSTVGDTSFGFATSETYQPLELAFFQHYLKGGAAPGLPGAFVFETGANRWRSFATWPPKPTQARTLYFQPRGGLAWTPPGAPGNAAADGDGGSDPRFDEFTSDPAKPVPYTLKVGSRWSKDYVAEDQRFAASRPDVVVYQSAPLEADVTLAGPITPKLYVSTTGTDADWVVKLIDVNPGEMPGFDPKSEEPDRGGQQTLVRGEPFRGRFRDSYETPKPFVPNAVTLVGFPMNDIFHTFKKGHRIMVQVQSSWFPFVDRNPQTYVPNIFEAKASDFTKQAHRIYHADGEASGIGVSVLPDVGG